MVLCARQGWFWGGSGWKGDNFLVCCGASRGEGKGLKTRTKAARRAKTKWYSLSGEWVCPKQIAGCSGSPLVTKSLCCSGQMVRFMASPFWKLALNFSSGTEPFWPKNSPYHLPLANPCTHQTPPHPPLQYLTALALHAASLWNGIPHGCYAPLPSEVWSPF